MNNIHEVSIGQIVKSKAGRDQDRLFIVIDIIDDQYVLVSDGDLRKIDKAKKKKVKHLAKYNIISEEVKNRVKKGEKITNLFLRRELEKLGLR
ncbi:KOW domain-containing RNA-binding protein [Inediibacterium massiliense]|uniref:KOW domain-containing RNA-binding protein n=1 Tax=Inediibacterium massiliense TaxID=1658111 RepID=UPI0018FEFDDF|nr:KOW domain-containing RNA-binding protein [Inediibacterium massiliense]